MPSTSELILGVDFGTSYSSAAVLIDGQVEWVRDRGENAIPTVIHVPRTGPMQVGFGARNLLATQPAATVQSIKRLLGRKMDDREVRLLDAGVGYRLSAGNRGLVQLHINGQTLAPEQLAAAVLSHLRDLAEHRFGARIRKAVITVPAAATPSYNAALRRAARLAHLQVLQVVPEPIAGALSLGMHGVSCHRRIAVCDFGGGTFDATLIQQDGLQFTPIACFGDSLLGGDDFDEVLASHVAGAVARRCGFEMQKDVVRWHTLKLRSESVKRILSREEVARFTMSDAYVESGQSQNIDLNIDRNWIEPRWAPLLRRSKKVLARLMDSSGWGPADIHDVVLIGGTSHIPLVRRVFAHFFEKDEVECNQFAHVAVAYGATLQTAGHMAVSTQLPSLTVSKASAAS